MAVVVGGRCYSPEPFLHLLNAGSQGIGELLIVQKLNDVCAPTPNLTYRACW